LAERTIRLWVAQLDSSMSMPHVDTDGAVWWRARRDNASAYLTTHSARTPHVWMMTGDALLAARGLRAVFAVWDSTDEVQRFELRRLVPPPNRPPGADTVEHGLGPCSPTIVF
jgi:hypothetical protein